MLQNVLSPNDRTIYVRDAAGRLVKLRDEPVNVAIDEDVDDQSDEDDSSAEKQYSRSAKAAGKTGQRIDLGQGSAGVPRVRRRGCRGGRKQRASQMQRKHWPGSAGPKGKLGRRTRRRLNQMQGSIHEGGDADKHSGDDEYEDLQDDELE